MSVNLNVLAQPRAAAGKGASRRLRREGLVPAILYGAHKAPEPITVSHNDLLKHLEQEAFYSSVLTLQLGEKTTSVVLKDMQRHPAKPFILHVDFMRISQDEKIRMTVPLHLLNEDKCRAVKAGGMISRTLSELEIICLPSDLPEFISIDMIDLDIGSVVHLSEVEFPEGVELARAPEQDEPVVIVYGPQADIDEDEDEDEVGDGDEGEGGEKPEA